MWTITPTEPVIQLQPTYLIDNDGVPMESNHHRIAINTLIRSVNVALTEREFFAGGNMFIYYSLAQIKNQSFKGADFFVVLNVKNDVSRKAWAVWQENGRYPDVIVELMSPYTADIDQKEKKDIYEQIFKTSEYYVYDLLDEDSLEGWRLNGKQLYDKIPVNDQGWLFSKKLNLWLGKWRGTIDRETGMWLRFYDTDGKLVPLPEELAQQKAQLAEQKAERLAQMLRDLGVNPDDV